MATFANLTFHPLQTSSRADDDSAPSPTSDPFWQAIPRTVPAGSLSMMAVKQTIPAPPQPQQASQAKTARQAAPVAATRRPQCTHMTMVRKYGFNTCGMCGKVPSIGWLYVCQQDRDLNPERATNPDSFPVVPNESSYFDVQARLAESLGMGTSVINGIRNHDYTLEQVDSLIEQKKLVLATIRRQENPSADSTPQTNATVGRTQSQPDGFLSMIASVGASAGLPMQAMAGADGILTNTAANSTSSTHAKRMIKSKKQTCNFQVCHSCRPFFQDRIFYSFEQVLSGCVPAITDDEIKQLAMLDPAVVCNLGMRQPMASPQPSPRSPESMDLTLHQGDGNDEDTSDWTPTSATISESDSEHLDGSDPYPCPGAGVCPLWSRYSGCAYDSGFDDGLRAMNHGFGPEPDLSRMTPENSLSRLRRVRGSISDTPGSSLSTASSISLPTPTTMPLTPVTPVESSFDDSLTMRLSKPGKAATICGPLVGPKRRNGRVGLGISGKDSSSSLGSEVEVEGGVALTEEAVETGVPDILADDE